MWHRKSLSSTFASLASALLVAACFATVAQAQKPSAENDWGKKLPSPPAKASVTLRGQTVTIDYSAPSLRGRHVGAELAPYGQVWRTGANAATTLKTPVDLTINGLTVMAGTYTIYSVPSEGTWKLIISTETGQWGTEYHQERDLGRVDMRRGPSPNPPAQQFVIKFEDSTDKSTDLHLIWENTNVFVPITAK
jgi:hypothetical protein